ncbi:hypothetical protein MTOK_19760 [Mycolicibacterium tokaiense]|nr:hypothetical protein MTOK_19760 [Mycolicibacterium tokaiense]
MAGVTGSVLGSDVSLMSAMIPGLTTEPVRCSLCNGYEMDGATHSANMFQTPPHRGTP